MTKDTEIKELFESSSLQSKFESSSRESKLFESRKDNPLFNTSYPLSPAYWEQYRTECALPFDMSSPIAFYIHIPFCRQICSFCEYTKMCVPSEKDQLRYIENTLNDISGFVTTHKDLKLYGFDIGGGTPTALSDKAFAELMNWYGEYIASAKVTEDFEASIEATFQTLTPGKIELIAGNGIKRVSLGMQSSSENVLQPLHRTVVSLEDMSSAINRLHRSGIRKVNIDLMYGLPGQTHDTLTTDIETINVLNPEQVTTYEFRTNQLGKGFGTDAGICYEQYCKLYELLTGLGYKAAFGQNTFSKDDTDCGLSSYLRHRMFDGWQYKGFGISAQSMSLSGVSYNKGKNGSVAELLSDSVISYEAWRTPDAVASKASDTCTQHPENVTREYGDTYTLPPQEVFSKFIAISGYSGGFSLPAARRIMGDTFDSRFHDTIDFLLSSDMVSIHGDRLQLTRKGFRHYGAVLSLFHTPVISATNR